MALAAKAIDSQARACAVVVPQMLWRSLVEHRPADQELSAYLRGHRELGARDRHVVTGSVFAAFRWWGWLRPYVPAEFRAALEAAGTAGATRPGETPPPPGLPAAAWARLLLAANLLEGTELPPVAELWARVCRVAPAEWLARPGGGDLDARQAYVHRLLGQELAVRSFALVDLLPAWAVPEIRCPQALGKLVYWLQRRPPVWVRAQGTDVAGLRQELLGLGLQVTPHPRLANALRVEQAPLSLYTTGPFRAGRFEIQDLASQVIGLVCSPRPGERWWDACAGAGGKTLLLADLMRRRGTVVATDIRSRKLDDLRVRARRGGFHNVRCRLWEGTPLPPDRATFHGVLVDAPCSCSGTWRRNPDARWRWLEAELPAGTDLQLRLLRHAASGVRPHGVLVYATCSLFERENLGVVRRFLAQDPGFELETFTNPLNGTKCAGMLQVWPWDGDCDAMFVARLRRRPADPVALRSAGPHVTSRPCREEVENVSSDHDSL